MRNIQFALTICLLSCLLLGKIEAQWIQTNGPAGGFTNCFALSEANLFVGAYGGVFLSTNNGDSWNEVNNGLTKSPIYTIAVSGLNLFAGTASGIFISTNNGDDWIPANNGLTILMSGPLL